MSCIGRFDFSRAKKDIKPKRKPVPFHHPTTPKPKKQQGKKHHPAKALLRSPTTSPTRAHPQAQTPVSQISPAPNTISVRLQEADFP